MASSADPSSLFPTRAGMATAAAAPLTAAAETAAAATAAAETAATTADTAVTNAATPPPPAPVPADDPRPQAPVEPQLEDCCGSGCVVCVFDAYETARERYQLRLAAWLARHPEDDATAN